MIRIFVGGIVAGIVFFMWGAVVHMGIQLHAQSISPVPNEDAFRAAVRAEIPRSGVYFFPAFPHEQGMTEEQFEAGMEAFQQRHQEGPIGLLFVRKEGTQAMHPMHFVGGLIIFVLTGLAASVLVYMAAPSLVNFFGRWLFVVGVGVTTIFFSDLSFWNWWPVSSTYTALMIVDHFVGWTLAGVALAAIVHRKQEHATARPTE